MVRTFCIQKTHSLFLHAARQLIVRSMPCLIFLASWTFSPTLAQVSQPPSKSAAWKQLTRPHYADDEELWKAFPLHSVRKFGQDIIVDCDGLKRIDFEKMELAPFHIQNSKSIYDAFDDRQGRLYALCSTEEKTILKVKLNASWSNIEVPEEVRSKPDEWAITAGDGEVTLASTHELFVYENERWEKKTFAGSSAIGKEYGNRRLLRDRMIYSAWDQGEWGGSIYTIDTHLGTVKTIYESWAHPVQDLSFAQNGTLWFVTGLSHMLSVSGGLFKYTDKAHCVSEVSGLDPEFLKTQNRQRTDSQKKLNWNLDSTTLAGMSIKKDGSVLVASTSYGVLHYENNEWRRITPEWSQNVWLCGFEVSDSGVAVLPVWETGIVLFDLKTHKYQFILPDYCKNKKPQKFLPALP